ncbi:MAG: PEP-CTERM sorting domain-containing protein [Chthoniobacterales bacterium]
MKRLPSFVAGFLTLLVAVLVARPAAADLSGLDLGPAANYALVDLGNTTLGWNSGPIAGSVLLGLGLTANLSGGNNGGLTNGGILYYDNTTTINGSLQNPPPEVLVPTTTTNAVLTAAQNVSNYATSLAATQTFGNITTTTTITGNGGLNVIDVTNIQNAKLTLSGNANDYFVFNLTNQIMENQPMTLSGGVLASHILFNLTGTGMVAVFQTSGGDVSYGTYLATHGGTFQFSNLQLTGALINTAGNVQFVSGSQIPTFVPFQIPEPATLSLVGIGLVALGIFGKRGLKAV